MALVAWVLLQERGNIFVALTNMVVSFGALFGRSLASGTVDTTVGGGPEFVQPGGEETFLFLLWIIALFLTYFITSRPEFSKGSKKSGWAAIVGALNGFLFLAVMLPKFNQLYVMGGGEFSQAPLRTFVALISQFIGFLIDSLRSFWQWISPLSSMSLLVIISLVLGLAAFTLRRGGSKPKSSG